MSLNTIQLLIERATLFLVVMMAARSLPVVDFGKVAVTQSVIAIFLMASGFGMGTAAVQLVARYGQRVFRSIELINYLFSGGCALILFLSADLLATRVYLDAALAPYLALASLIVLASGCSGIAAAVLIGKQRYGDLIWIKGLTACIAIGASFALAERYGVRGWLVAIALAEALKWLLLRYRIARLMQPAPVPPWSMAKTRVLLRRAAPIALSGFLIMPANWLAMRQLLVADGYEAVAILGVVDQWVALLIFLPTAVGSALLPLLSRVQSVGNRSRLGSAGLIASGLIALVAGLLLMLVFPLLTQLYGNVFDSYTGGILAIVPLVVIIALSLQVDVQLVAARQERLLLSGNLVFLAIYLPSMLAVVAMGMGFTGILLTRTLGYLIRLIFVYSRLRKPGSGTL